MHVLDQPEGSQGLQESDCLRPKRLTRYRMADQEDIAEKLEALDGAWFFHRLLSHAPPEFCRPCSRRGPLIRLGKEEKEIQEGRIDS